MTRQLKLSWFDVLHQWKRRFSACCFCFSWCFQYLGSLVTSSIWFSFLSLTWLSGLKQVHKEGKGSINLPHGLSDASVLVALCYKSSFWISTMLRGKFLTLLVLIYRVMGRWIMSASAKHLKKCCFTCVWSFFWLLEDFITLKAGHLPTLLVRLKQGHPFAVSPTYDLALLQWVGKVARHTCSF